MRVNKRDISKWLVFLISLVIGCIGISLSTSIYSHLCIIVILVVLCVIISNFNFSHPLFWFSIFFFLYACAYMMIIMMYPNDALAKGYDRNSALLILISLGVTALCAGMGEHIYKYEELKNPEQYWFDLQILNILFTIFCLILFVCVAVLRLQGVTSKQIQWEQHNLFWVFAAYSTRFLVFIVALLLFMGEEKRRTRNKIIIATVLIGVYSMSTGERDGLLRLIILLLLALSMLGLIRKSRLIIIGVAGFAMMILMNYLKYFFSTGVLNVDFLAKGNIWYAFLYSDFADCGSNLQTLLNHPELNGIKGFSVIVSDFLSAFLPSRLMNNIYGDITGWNVSEWYNDYFFRGSSWSRAFTIIGEGYLIGGTIGVIVVFVLLGLLIRWLYKNSGNSPYYAALYVYGAATIISSFRGDLSSVFQGLVRIPVILIFIMWVAKKIIKPS